MQKVPLFRSTDNRRTLETKGKNVAIDDEDQASEIVEKKSLIEEKPKPTLHSYETMISAKKNSIKGTLPFLV